MINYKDPQEVYKKVINRRIWHDRGSNNNIAFIDNVAIKYQRYLDECSETLQKYNTRRSRERFQTEFLVANDIIEMDLITPQMHELYIGSGDEIPFLVMERLNLIKIQDLNTSDREIAERQYIKATNKLTEAGYNKPMDLSFKLGFNVGWDMKRNSICFYDFENWRGKRVDELRQIKTGVKN